MEALRAMSMERQTLASLIVQFLVHLYWASLMS